MQISAIGRSDKRTLEQQDPSETRSDVAALPGRSRSISSLANKWSAGDPSALLATIAKRWFWWGSLHAWWAFGNRCEQLLQLNHPSFSID
jgi:hypothetical protein